MTYYAALSPRGFQNEIEVHKFASRKERNTWVDETDRAYAVTSKEARRILAYRGDAATQSYNSEIDHNDEDFGIHDRWAALEAYERWNDQVTRDA